MYEDIRLNYIAFTKVLHATTRPYYLYIRISSEVTDSKECIEEVAAKFGVHSMKIKAYASTRTRPL